MDIPEDQSFQAMFGNLDHDPLDLKQLDEYLGNDDKNSEIYLDDNAHLNLAYSTDQVQAHSHPQPISTQPGVMFYTGPKFECGGVTTGLPIDIPNFAAHYNNVPLTPPDSDGPDSPVDQRVLHSGGLGPSSLDVRQLMLMRLSMGSSFPLTSSDSSSEIASHLMRTNSECEPRKKRKIDDCERLSLNGLPAIKTEPGLGEDDMYLGGSLESLNTPSEMESSYQCLKWQPYKTGQWNDLYDESFKKLPPPEYRVDADKGFNFSFADDAFVCQKKNHFQITTHLTIESAPRFIKVKDGFRQIEKFRLHLYGVKMESQNCRIRVEQSQADRSKRSYEPVTLHLSGKEATKMTVGRLHFSETTSNNMRKKGKPNPDQRYFLLAVSVHAQISKNEDYLVCSNVSERIIVRASNPGQFENDVEVVWSRGQTTDSVFRMGRVGINTDRPEESLSVHGNLKVTGHLVHPSDKRVKKDITEVDSSEQLRNVARMKLYKYRFSREFLEHAGLSGEEEDPSDTGVLAQDLKEVLPDAVREADDIVLSDGQKIEKFLVVDKERIFMENVGAVKELCKLTDKLETRINELESMNIKLQKRRCDTASSVFSCTSGLSSFSRTSSVRCSRKSTVSGKHKDAKEKGRRRHYHCKRHNRVMEAEGEEDQSYCTPRFMQILIVLLVTVMALSVGAMATLYIMQNDDNSAPSEKGSIAWQEKPTSNSITFTVKPREPVTTHKVIIPGFSTTSSKEIPSKSLPSLRTATTDVLVPTVTRLTERVPGGTNVSRASHKPPPWNPVETKEPPDVARPTTTKLPRCCDYIDKNLPSDIAGKKVYYESSTTTGQKSSSDDPDVTLLEREYTPHCDGTCRENSTYFIPFSPDIPFQAVTLEINSTRSSQVLLCKTETKHDCPEKTAHPQYDTGRRKDDWGTCHRWRLPVAYYYSSSYYFRLVLTPPANNQNPIDCSSSLSSHSGQIKDLNLHFIRKCSS